MNIAEKVRTVITTQCPYVFSLSAGLGLCNNQPVHFPIGALIREKRNNDGLCLLAEYKYADDSMLTYTHDTETERYALTVKQAVTPVPPETEE